MVTLTINGTPRTETGKKATKAVKREGLIPCVLYGEEGNVHFTVEPREIRDLVFTGEFKIANVQVDGKSYRSILKDVQFHPVKDSVMHIDFLELHDGRKVKVEVPIRFEGVSPGVRNGGKFMQSVRKVLIKTTPDKLVDEMIADISTLKLGFSIRIKDIKEVEGIEILNPGTHPVASVVVPRILIDAEEEEEEEEGEEGGEGGEETKEETTSAE